jgi:transcription elongation GreA/GreB family factor
VTYRHKGVERTITIVGDDEADPAASLISFLAPLSRAMLRAEIGDVIAFGGDADAIEIIGIEGAAAG